MPSRIVVVGASLAGLRTVQALRRRGSDAHITLIGDEAELPTDRPPLSKQVLLNTHKPSSIELIGEDALRDLDLHLTLGRSATGLDLSARRITLDDGTSIPFDTLIIATGSRPITLPGSERFAGVHTLRTMADAQAIRAGLEAGARVAVIGGGFIGAEVASSARTLGRDVTIIDALPVLMYRGLGATLGGLMGELHQAHGVHLRLGIGVVELVGGAEQSGRSQVEAVRLADGSIVPADLVIVGIGTTPNTHWLADSGLTIADGVVSDEQLRAAEGVYAVGDVVRWPNAHYGESERAQHWTAAVDQASAVAQTLTGTPTPCAVLPYVWSDQFGSRLQIMGRIREQDELRFTLREPEKFLAISGGDGRLQGAVGLNSTRDLIRQRMALMNNEPWEAEPEPVSPEPDPAVQG
jgi:NADPH-dependent 2,4-dienoyl-CoA reductase/sulfur reductase-like enzyme